MKVQITKGKKTALLFGATGMVGGHCLETLLASDIYSKVIVFGRKEIKNDHPKLVQYTIDFNDLENHKALIKGDDLFCSLGTTMKKAGSKTAFRKVDFEYVLKIGEIAKDNKVNQFLLVSSVGADKEALIYYSQIKGEIEEAIQNLQFWAIHIFRPSILLGQRAELRPAERLAARLTKGLDFFIGKYLKQYKPVEGTVVAKAMLNAAQGIQEGTFFYASHELQKLANKKGLVKK